MNEADDWGPPQPRAHGAGRASPVDSPPPPSGEDTARLAVRPIDIAAYALAFLPAVVFVVTILTGEFYLWPVAVLCFVGAAMNGWVALSGRHIRVAAYRFAPAPRPAQRISFGVVAVFLLAIGMASLIAWLG